MIESVSSGEVPAGTTTHEKVAALFETMYSGYFGGDPGRIDALLAPAFTMFDSSSRELVSGFDELARLRATRVANPDVRETALEVEELRVFERGTDLLACFFLRVSFKSAAGEPLTAELGRTTAWIIRDSGRLLVQHLHEDVIESGGLPL